VAAYAAYAATQPINVNFDILLEQSNYALGG